jgi:adenine C2-methylase RlmN of 23S rRNA A2503 and tRNA A37
MSLQTKCGLFGLMLLGFYHFHVISIALYTRIHKKSTRSITMQYSSTELLNLKALTAKKLGTKLSDDYLLISSTMKASQSRSEILDCIPQVNAVNGNSEKFFKAKIVKEQDRFERELKNYKVAAGNN